MTMIWIVLAMDIVALVSGYFQYDLLNEVDSGHSISMDTATANDTREQMIGIVYFILFVISAVTFIQWFRRAYYNLHIKTPALSFGEGWAAGSWFVPIISLYRPFQIMKELYRVTGLLLEGKGLLAPGGLSTSTLGWWWALWLISNLMGQFVFRFTLNAESLDDLITATVAGMVDNGIGIVLAVVTVNVIRDYARVEPLLLELKEEEIVAGELQPEALSSD